MTTLTHATPAMPASLGPAQARRTAPAAGKAFTAGDLLRVVQQRLVMVILIWLFMVGATIGGTALWIAKWPKYQADAYVKVESSDPGDPLEEAKGGPRIELQAMEMLVKDQAVFVKSPDVLQAALEDPEVKRTSWYASIMAINDADRSPVDELIDIVSVTPVPATSFMIISVSGKVPNELPTICNTIVDKYYLRVNDLAKTRYREESDRLRKEAEDAKTALDKKNAEIDQKRSDLPASVLTPGGTNQVTEELMTVSSLAVELEMEKLGRKQIYESLKEMKPDEMPVTADMQAAIENDPELGRMRDQIDAAEQNINITSVSLGPNHRTVKAMQSQAQQMKDRLTTMQMEKLTAIRNQQIQMAQDDFYRAQAQEQQLAEKKLAAESKQRDLDSKVARLMRDLEERETIKVNYDSLLRQHEMLAMTVRRDNMVHVSKASSAIAPKRRSSPQWFINIPIGVVVGLLVAVSLAVLLELADTSVRTPRDVLRHTSMVVLGTVPALDDEEIDIERIELASVTAPHSIVAEAFRQLRTNLFFSAPVEHQGVLLITSPGAEDGKTTVATNLAASIALSGRRVLLVDANFRRPGLRKLFPTMRAEGLSNILIGQARLADTVTASEIPSLSLLNTGPTPPNPAELLGSRYLRDLIADARSQFDQIIIDGPPALLVSDAMVLSGATDGVILVCRFRNTSRGALIRAKSQLDAINARVLGAVLNAVQTTRGGYFRKHYRAFYDYQSEEGGAVPQLESAAASANEAGANAAEADTDSPPDDARTIGDHLAAIAPSDSGTATDDSDANRDA